MDSLIRHRRAINRALAGFLRARRRTVVATAPALVPLVDRATAFVLHPGSKRIRSFLVVAGYGLIRGRTSADVARLSIIAELFHAGLLVHDDIIDRDVRRHNAPTLHVDIGRNAPAPRGNHYGVSQAILLGNVLEIWGRQLVLESRLAPRVQRDMLRVIEDTFEKTHYGEMLDVLLAHRPRATEQEILTVHRLKTAQYTFEAPLRLGAILAGATMRQHAVLHRFALPVGVAFQMQDDALGLFGDRRAVGKSVTSDLAEHKKTLLMLYAERRLRGRRKSQFRRMLRHTPVSKASLAAVRLLVRQSGAFDAHTARAHRYVAAGLRALTRERTFARVWKERLASLAALTTNRGY